MHLEWLLPPVFDPHPSPARTGFSYSGMTQVATSITDAMVPGPPASSRCHWFLGEGLGPDWALCSGVHPGVRMLVLKCYANMQIHMDVQS